MTENNRYFIVADDFTGANDTGVQIRRRGIPVNVVFSGSMIAADESSYVLDTESRALPPEEAAAAVTGALDGVDFAGFRHLMKKVDSTIRGAIGAEVAAMDRAVRPELVLFAPALPDLGRTTQDGVHRLNGVPITRTEMAKDPKTPVRQDNLRELLQAEYDEPVRHLSLDAVRGQITFQDARVFTADAVTNDDLNRLVRAALATGRRILWVGTAAMADTLLAVEREVSPAMAVVASLSAVTNKQLRYVCEQGVERVVVPIAELLDGSVTPEAVAAGANALLREGRDLVLCSAASWDRETEYEKADRAGARAGLSPEQVSRFTQETVGRIARLALEGVEVSGLFLTGGDTAISFFDQAESQGSQIDTEIAVGIPLMRLRGGPFDSLRVVTKAGAFGGEDAIFYALRKLKEVEI